MAEPRVVITKEAEGGTIAAGLAVVAGSAAARAQLPAAAGARALGISGLGADAAGKQFPVIILGLAKATAAAAIAVGDPVEAAGVSGKLQKAAPALGANANIVGYAMSAAAATDDVFDLLVLPSSLQG